jgi:hypothetical protein
MIFRGVGVEGREGASFAGACMAFIEKFKRLVCIE